MSVSGEQTREALRATHGLGDVVTVREFRFGDEPALHAVYHSAVHGIARENYSQEQVDAWAPESVDQDMWAARMRGIRPFVAEREGQIVGYADVQYDGYIDHFFVAAAHCRQGVGTRLMQRIHEEATLRECEVLTADVSVTAQPFFQHFGFWILENRAPLIRGVMVPNALMRKDFRESPPFDDPTEYA